MAFWAAAIPLIMGQAQSNSQQGGSGGVAGLLQGFAGFKAGKINAKTSRMEADMAWRDANARAGGLASQASYDLGADRAQAAASGFDGSTAVEALSQKAQSYGLDIDAILNQGRLQRDALLYQAKLSKRQGIMSLAGGFLKALDPLVGGQLMKDVAPFGGGGRTVNPAVVSGDYGQMGRFGSRKLMIGSTGRLIGGV